VRSWLLLIPSVKPWRCVCPLQDIQQMSSDEIHGSIGTLANRRWWRMDVSGSRSRQQSWSDGHQWDLSSKGSTELFYIVWHLLIWYPLMTLLVYPLLIASLPTRLIVVFW
jgi:hypothetical protein